MRTPTLLAGLALLLAIIAAPLHAAEAPRVGLVLAGGGARGLAHIGVIRYLEEQGVRVHAVAGTSMGAIIGGLYASGLSATELEEAARNLDWRYAFDDSTPREQLPFRRKEEDYDFMVGAPLRFKDGRPQLPMGAIEGQHLNFVLHDLVAHTARIRDFDRLPIPYRAVAADIVTGEPVVLSTGDLALAMRASMSIPGVFTPVEIDGHLLVDGGIAKNIPVDVAQAMGVDRLVVVDIGTPLAPREELDNVLALVDQLTNILTRSNSEAQLALMREGDVLVKPALDDAGIGSTSFDRTDDAIALGYAAARALQPQIAALAGGGSGQSVAARRPKLVLPKIAEVRVDTDAPVSRRLLRNMITQPIGERLDRERIERDISAIYGLDAFSRVDYEVSKEPQGYVLDVYGKANPAGDDVLKLGLSWDQDSRGDSEFGLRASWHQRGVNRLGAEWYTAGQLGGRSSFFTQFYQPIDTGRRLFLDTSYRFEQRRINLANDGEVRARAIVDQHQLELAPGYDIGNVARVRAGAYVGTSDLDIQIGSPLLSSASDDDGGYFAELRVDTLDRTYFPGRGVKLDTRFSQGDEGWGSEFDYQAWDTRGQASWSLGRNTLTAFGRWSQLDLDEGGGNAGVTLPSKISTLGGFLALSGYTRDSLAGNYLGFAALTYYRRLTERSLLPVDLPVYAGMSLEAGNTWFDKDRASLDDLVHAGSLFLGVDSPLGPVYLGVGVGEDGQRAMYLQVGQLFD